MRQLADVGLIHDGDHDQATVEVALRREVANYLMNTPLFATEDGRMHKIMAESTIIWMWDQSKPITFDEEIVRHLRGEERPVIEALMDRPLLGVPCVNEHLYGRQGLCPISCLDLTNRGGCMVAQIVECVMDMKKVPGDTRSQTGGSRKGGVDTRTYKDTRKRELVPRFTQREVEAEFNRIFAEMYPGNAVNEDDVEAGLVEPERAAPYQYDNWDKVGVTSKMCVAFCDRNKIGLRILYKNAVIFKNDVLTTGPGSHEKPVIVYHIWGDHAWFYDNRDVKRGAAELR